MIGIPWLLQKFTLSSEKNGEIRVSQSLGQWSVVVDGCEQTTPYTNIMWADALLRLQQEIAVPVHQVLMLGVAAGGALKMLYEKFPGCSITAVDHDPQMIKIAEELALYKPYPKPAFIQADAAAVLDSLVGQFDLIIIDLFTGEEPPQFIAQHSFIAAVAKHLTSEGYLLINAYKRAKYLDAIEPTYGSSKRWTYRYNFLGLFSNPKI